jgi:outer membrane protein OmpU
MRLSFLHSTALVSAMLSSAAAFADGPKVTIGGFSDFQAGHTSDDKDADTRSADFRNDNEITVKVDGKTSAGLGYGAYIELEADTTDDVKSEGTNAARTYTYLEGGWGRVELGDTKSSAGKMRVDASSLAVATGGINGAWSYFVNSTSSIPATGFVSNSKLVTEHGRVDRVGYKDTYNATKLNYYTPKMSGFQAGVSYTPALNRGQTVDRADNTAGDIENIWDLGASYAAKLGEHSKLTTAATYEHGSAETSSTEDTAAWNIGALLTVDDFGLAASYGDWDDSDNTAGLESDYWTLGASYTTGAVGISATYMESTRDASATTENEFSNLVLGADYKLAAGLTPYAEVAFYDFESAGTTYDNAGTTIILGTQVAF